MMQIDFCPLGMLEMDFQKCPDVKICKSNKKIKKKKGMLRERENIHLHSRFVIPFFWYGSC